MVLSAPPAGRWTTSGSLFARSSANASSFFFHTLYGYHPWRGCRGSRQSLRRRRV